MEVWNGRPREWRLSAECHGRPEWIDAAAALRLRWQSPRPVKSGGRGICNSGLPTEEIEDRYPTVTDTRIVTPTYRHKRPPLQAVRAFFAVIVAAAVLALGACNLDAYPCRGP